MTLLDVIRKPGRVGISKIVSSNLELIFEHEMMRECMSVRFLSLTTGYSYT